MHSLPAVTTQVTTTQYSWINAPMVVALIFGFAGTVFIGIYILRRIRSKAS